MQAVIVGNSTSYALAASQKYCCHETLRNRRYANQTGYQNARQVSYGDPT